VVAVGLPRVREGELAAVEQVLGPAGCLERAVVGAGLDEADRALRLLAEASGEDASGRPAARDDHVVRLHAAIIAV
jgi:hypothetical protein